MKMGITKELATYAARLKFKEIPEEVVDRAKYFFLDFIGVACRGSKVDSTRAMYRFIADIDPGDRSGGVVAGTGLRVTPLHAALANGTSAHSVELDDVNNESSLHPGVVVFPAALAMAERCSAGGRRFIEAAVLGYDVVNRLGKALGPANTYRRGFHPTAVCGVFGGSAAATKILGLSEEKTTWAMGIAGSQASGSQEYLHTGAWTKRFHAGWAASAGMISALMAARGFTGPQTIIEGKFGFLHSYSDGADPGKVLPGLGQEFEIMKTSVKPHACCRYMQPGIDAVLKIVKENDLKPDRIGKIRIGVLTAGFPIVADPIEKKRRPLGVVDAQFSMPFGAAVAALYRDAGLKRFSLAEIGSKGVKAMMDRVECFVNTDLDRTYPKQWEATAEIVTRDGKRYDSRIAFPKGDPENPLTWDEMIGKFHDLTGRIYPKEQRMRIIDQVRRLETIGDLRKWSPLLLKK
jgi:2-methylcitrate dehydratase PrpD